MAVRTASENKIPACCINTPRSDFEANQLYFLGEKTVYADNFIDKFVVDEGAS